MHSRYRYWCLWMCFTVSFLTWVTLSCVHDNCHSLVIMAELYPCWARHTCSCCWGSHNFHLHYLANYPSAGRGRGGAFAYQTFHQGALARAWYANKNALHDGFVQCSFILDSLLKGSQVSLLSFTWKLGRKEDRRRKRGKWKKVLYEMAVSKVVI